MLINSMYDRGEAPPTKRRRIDNGNDEDEDAYAQITLDDLRDPAYSECFRAGK
jgi:hypothetical protein